MGLPMLVLCMTLPVLIGCMTLPVLIGCMTLPVLIGCMIPLQHRDDEYFKLMMSRNIETWLLNNLHATFNPWQLQF